MADEHTTIPLIRTKLHRPPVAKDHLRREHLLDRLEKNRQRPLTLISAPAGYGKSTLLSGWLESCDIPSAWVSLDDNDNDLFVIPLDEHNRHAPLNEDKWYVLEKWLAQLPDDIVQQRPALLMAKAPPGFIRAD